MIYQLKIIYRNQNDQNPILFTTFSLEPNNEWAHITNFLNFFSREDEKEYQKITGDLLADLRANNKVTNKNDSNTEFYEHSDELVQPAFDFFDKHFCWKSGEYNMQISVITDSEKSNITKYFRFTIFESHTETLCSIKDYYKYGRGIYWDPKVQTNVILEVTEA